MWYRRDSPKRLHIELHEAALVVTLREELAMAKAALKHSEAVRRDMEFKLVNEYKVNMQLTDLCRENGINFRPSLDMRSWSD